MSTAQLVTYGDCQHGRFEEPVRTHEHRRFWHGEFQLGHLVYWTSNKIKRVVRSALAGEAYSLSEAVEEAQWLRSVPADMWPSVPSSLPHSLRTVEMDSLRRPIVTLSDSFNLCQAVKSDKGTGSDKRLRIVTAMLRQVFCNLCICHHSHNARRRLDEGLGPLPFVLAAMNAHRHVFVTSDSSTGVRTTLPTPSESVPTLKMAIGSQLVRSAESQSGKSGPCTR